mmetsp:Transcript_48390/g.97365  ORF Transcript_48390/g.97365 Transcript_48390/m.97365 type:complete len:361 (-) Transcript_48390:326-1408(-)
MEGGMSISLRVLILRILLCGVIKTTPSFALHRGFVSEHRRNFQLFSSSADPSSETTYTVKTLPFQGKTFSYRHYPAAFESVQMMPLLLVHPVGVGISAWFWDRFAREWTESGGGPVVVPDLLGCGRRDRWTSAENDDLAVLPLWTEQCAALIQHEFANKGMPVTVLAQGGLAPVGIRLAAKNINAIVALVLTTPPSWEALCMPLKANEVAKNLSRLQALPKFVFGLLSSRQAIRFFSALFLFAKAGNENAVVDGTWLNEACNDAADDTTRFAIWHFNAGTCEIPDYSNDLMNIRVPTLVVTGEETSDDPAGRVLSFERNMQRARGAVVPETKNVIPWQNPLELRSATDDFLASYGLSSRR